MIKWIKPNGNILETNEEKATIEYCVQLGFKRVDSEPEAENEHIAQIQQFNDKELLALYVSKHFKTDLDKRASLENMKVKAIEIINGNGE